MIKFKEGNARHSRAIVKFSKATAPAYAPCLRPAGNVEIDYFGLKLVVHVIRSSVNQNEVTCEVDPKISAFFESLNY